MPVAVHALPPNKKMPESGHLFGREIGDVPIASSEERSGSLLTLRPSEDAKKVEYPLFSGLEGLPVSAIGALATLRHEAEVVVGVRSKAGYIGRDRNIIRARTGRLLRRRFQENRAQERIGAVLEPVRGLGAVRVDPPPPRGGGPLPPRRPARRGRGGGGGGGGRGGGV